MQSPQNITQKPRIPTGGIFPADYLYLVRTLEDKHVRGADFGLTVLEITEDYALPVEANMLGTVILVDATEGPVELTTASELSEYSSFPFRVVKVDSSSNEVNCFSGISLANQHDAVDLFIHNASIHVAAKMLSPKAVVAAARTVEQFNTGDVTGSPAKFTFTHNIGNQHCIIQIYDNNNKLILPDDITLVDANSAYIFLNSFMPLPGTWTAIAI